MLIDTYATPRDLSHFWTPALKRCSQSHLCWDVLKEMHFQQPHTHQNTGGNLFLTTSKQQKCCFARYLMVDYLIVLIITYILKTFWIIENLHRDFNNFLLQNLISAVVIFVFLFLSKKNITWCLSYCSLTQWCIFNHYIIGFFKWDMFWKCFS